MKFEKSILFLLVVMLLTMNIRYAQSEVKPMPILGDNMVLQQQQKSLPIWGIALPNKQITINTSWNNKTYKTQSTLSGEWKVAIETPKAGGPYTITLDDGKKTILKNILIGEVWICSGQSNMEMTMKGFPGQPLEATSNIDILKSDNANLRLFDVANDTGMNYKKNVSGEWKIASPLVIKDFSAIAYYFGKMIQSTLNIPVGIITVDWGGSPIESWMSNEMLIDINKETLQTLQKNKTPQRIPSALYNGMLHPLLGLNMKGMIWYQGEANVERANQYEDLFSTFVSSLRKLWDIGEFPFYYCQIAPYAHYKVNSAFLREAQLNAESLIPNSGMAVLMDAGTKHCIHPMKKQVVGERLALQALSQTYGIKGFVAQSPIYKEMTIKNDTIILSFERVPMGLTSYYKPITLFTLAGEDLKFFPAKAWIVMNKVFLVSEQVKNPIAARYAFENFVEGELYSVEGLPVSSFRTDKFE